MEFSSPGLIFKPQHYSKAWPDLRNSRLTTSADRARLERTTPVVARLEALGAQLGETWDYFRRPRAGARYCGGEAPGTLNFLPPNVGIEQVLDGTEPSTVPDTGLNFYRTFTGWGTPTDDGGIVSGFKASNVDGEWTITHVDDTGTETEALRYDPVTGKLYVDGVDVSAGGDRPWVYGGDGSDGAAAFDGSTTVAGASRSGSTYTLTRSTSYTDATISAGVVVKTNGHFFAGTGTLTCEGKIERNGGDAASSAGGAAPGGSQGLGLAGATGRTSSGNGTGGSAFSNALGGSGGNGGATSGSTGGTGGTASRPATDVQPIYNSVAATAQNGRMVSLSAVIDPSGGGSGGAGGFEVGASGRSGSGGASGGNMQIAFKAIVLTGAGTIEAKGGNAYAASGTGDMGGGGGGGGGCIRCLAQTYTGCTVGSTVLVTKGLKSNGTGAGANGTDGADGQAFLFVV